MPSETGKGFRRHFYRRWHSGVMMMRHLSVKSVPSSAIRTGNTTGLTLPQRQEYPRMSVPFLVVRTGTA
ncbi:hypothetical protein NEICINOT_03954 [Neisseria cinerea ATCC 14685]|uniref:Uncharacterized protein n=1 Tax=Neisseria cinerea ATCC 14685 TaxID=546262 RepID=D0W2S0_NEICI|nr:hypothetical protein NEICINOT_03954 [Neisseria cinerea ATCC 14685]